MKWDIDAALKQLSDGAKSTPLLTLALVTNEFLAAQGLRVPRSKRGVVCLCNPKTASDAIRLALNLSCPVHGKDREEHHVWCIALGRVYQAKVFVYGFSIREAYLRARRMVKAMSKAEQAELGLRAPKKGGSFQGSRKKKTTSSRAAPQHP